MTVPERWGREDTSLAHRLLRQPHNGETGSQIQPLVSPPGQGEWLVTSPRTEARARGTEPHHEDREATAHSCPALSWAPTRRSNLKGEARRFWTDGASCEVCEWQALRKDGLEGRARALGFPDSVPISQDPQGAPPGPQPGLEKIRKLRPRSHGSKWMAIWAWSLFCFSLLSFTKT